MPRSKWAKSISDLLRVPLRAYGTLIFYRDLFCSASAYLPARNKRDLFFSLLTGLREGFCSLPGELRRNTCLCAEFTLSYVRFLLLETRVSNGWTPGCPEGGDPGLHRYKSGDLPGEALSGPDREWKYDSHNL